MKPIDLLWKLKSDSEDDQIGFNQRHLSGHHLANTIATFRELREKIALRNCECQVVHEDCMDGETGFTCIRCATLERLPTEEQLKEFEK